MCMRDFNLSLRRLKVRYTKEILPGMYTVNTDRLAHMHTKKPAIVTQLFGGFTVQHFRQNIFGKTQKWRHCYLFTNILLKIIFSSEKTDYNQDSRLHDFVSTW